MLWNLFIQDQEVTKDVLTVTGLYTGSEPNDNLVIKTLLKLRVKNSFPFLKIHLHKGNTRRCRLGGGSSDAACLLKIINKHFELNIDNTDLKTIALETAVIVLFYRRDSCFSLWQRRDIDTCETFFVRLLCGSHQPGSWNKHR